ncbi:MAG: FMN-binding protein [Clostridia bacterium]|nr:FMN-binding protein [Clostridia bacterium]
MMEKKTLSLMKGAVVLTVICMVAAILLGVVNRFAAPVIEQAENEKKLATLSVVLPDAKGFSDPLELEGAPATVKTVYEETSGLGYAMLCETETGFDTLAFSIGITADGRIAGLALTSVFYSAGDKGKESAIENLIDSYKGQSDTENGVIISGATKSSNAMKAAIADALGYAKQLKEGK